MLKVRVIFVLGVWTALLPYLGFPYIIKNILFGLTGFAMVYVSLVLYKEMKNRARVLGIEVEQKVFDNFSENQDFVPTSKVDNVENNEDV